MSSQRQVSTLHSNPRVSEMICHWFDQLEQSEKYAEPLSLASFHRTDRYL
jgi:hypothetical protein